MVDERHFDKAAEVFRGFVESREHAAVFLDPADQAFDDVALFIGCAVKLDLAGVQCCLPSIPHRNRST